MDNSLQFLLFLPRNCFTIHCKKIPYINGKCTGSKLPSVLRFFTELPFSHPTVYKHEISFLEINMSNSSILKQIYIISIYTNVHLCVIEICIVYFQTCFLSPCLLQDSNFGTLNYRMNFLSLFPPGHIQRHMDYYIVR